jgi:hypothetical protein
MVARHVRIVTCHLSKPHSGRNLCRKNRKQFSTLRPERHLSGMANTYTQIYIHAVFAVEGRQNLIDPAHNDELQKYITGIVTRSKAKTDRDK